MILERKPGGLHVAKSLNWSNGLFDLTWSESQPNVVVSASGDGSLQVWQLEAEVKTDALELFIIFSNLNIFDAIYLYVFRRLLKYSKPIRKRFVFIPLFSRYILTLVIHIACFLSGQFSRLEFDSRRESRDQRLLGSHAATCKYQHYQDCCRFDLVSINHSAFQWDVSRDEPLATLVGHESLVYSAVWSPFIRGCCASVSGRVLINRCFAVSAHNVSFGLFRRQDLARVGREKPCSVDGHDSSSEFGSAHVRLVQVQPSELKFNIQSIMEFMHVDEPH